VDIDDITARYANIEKLIEENPGFPNQVTLLNVQAEYTGGALLSLDLMAYSATRCRVTAVSESREWTFGILQSATHLFTQLAESAPDTRESPVRQRGAPSLRTVMSKRAPDGGERLRKQIAIAVGAALVVFLVIHFFGTMKPEQASVWAGVGGVITWVIQFAYDRMREA
jgi:Flp pilus assembly protein TadB